jgi:cytoplasmic iron level regulating protein YaaA (DUF328/UPF0246 family)
MLTVLSPSKTIEYTYPGTDYLDSQPRFIDDTTYLVKRLQSYSVDELGTLMKMSDKLAAENYQRYANWQDEFTEEVAHPAIFAFKGGVYQGLASETFDQASLTYAQDRLVILSGLYGILRPMDPIQAYRFEMGTKFKTERGKNLYEFWGDKLAAALTTQAREIGSDYLINLASNEYFKSIKNKALELDVIDIDFREVRDGQLKFVSFNAKKARGMMARYIMTSRCKTLDDLRGFDEDGYRYDDGASTDHKLHFVKLA